MSASRKRTDGWLLARIGLLRQLCGLSMPEIARETGPSTSGVEKKLARHRHLVTHDGAYAERVAELADGAMQHCGLAADEWVSGCRTVEEES